MTSAVLVVLAAGSGCGAEAPQKAASSSEVPTDMRAALLRQYSITVDTELEVRPYVAANRAIRVASTYGFGGTAPSAYLVRYSDPNDCEYASELAAGQPETNVGTPLSVNLLAWLVLLVDLKAPIYGPPGRRGPDTYDATLAVFVDAKIGADLGAVTLPPG